MVQLASDRSFAYVTSVCVGVFKHAENPLKILPKSIVFGYRAFDPGLPPLPLTVAVTIRGEYAHRNTLNPLALFIAAANA